MDQLTEVSCPNCGSHLVKDDPEGGLHMYDCQTCGAQWEEVDTDEAMEEATDLSPEMTHMGAFPPRVGPTSTLNPDTVCPHCEKKGLEGICESPRSHGKIWLHECEEHERQRDPWGERTHFEGVPLRERPEVVAKTAEVGPEDVNKRWCSKCQQYLGADEQHNRQKHQEADAERARQKVEEGFTAAQDDDVEDEEICPICGSTEDEEHNQNEHDDAMGYPPVHSNPGDDAAWTKTIGELKQSSTHECDNGWVMHHNFQPWCEDSDLHHWDPCPHGSHRTAAATPLDLTPKPNMDKLRALMDRPRPAEGSSPVPTAFRPPKVPDTDKKGQPVLDAKGKPVKRERTAEESQTWWDNLPRPKTLLQQGAHCTKCGGGAGDSHEGHEPKFSGNAKLGPQVWHTDLPPGAGVSCPGESGGMEGDLEKGVDFCQGCYAVKGQRLFPSVKESYARNLKYLNEDPEGYGNQLSHEVSKMPEGHLFRPHTSGDIKDAQHAEILKKVARENPDRKIYLYTRSWRVPSLRPHIDELAQMPNVTVQHSIDPGIRGEFDRLEQEHPLPGGQKRNAFYGGPKGLHRPSELKAHMKETGMQGPICPEANGACCDEPPGRHPKPENVDNPGPSKLDHVFKGKQPDCSSCKLCYTAKPGTKIAIPVH